VGAGAAQPAAASSNTSHPAFARSRGEGRHMR